MKRSILLVLLAAGLTAPGAAQDTWQPSTTAPANPAATPQPSPVPGSTMENPTQPPAGGLRGRQGVFFPRTFSNAPGSTGFLTNQSGFLTNQFGFNPATGTNLFQTGNFGVAEVQNFLESLQANVHQAIPLLAAITAGNQGIDPRTGLPNQLLSRAGAQQAQAPFVGTIGTNTVQIDQQTYHLLVVLQNNLQQTLLALRDLNGTGAAASPQNAGQLAPTGLTNRIYVVPPTGAAAAPMPNPNVPPNLPRNNIPGQRILQR